jgi:hypothetical protein
MTGQDITTGEPGSGLPVVQHRCGVCGVIYSARALAAHRPEGTVMCARPEALGLVQWPGPVWAYPDE